jgi:hypothetical protein
VILAREWRRNASLRGRAILGVVALISSVWAVIGSGWETAFRGLLLLLAGVPVYWWRVRRRDRDPRPE